MAMKAFLKHIGIWLFVSVLAIFLFGIPTALIPTGFYKRMLPPSWLDYLFLVSVSLLVGANVSLYFYKKHGKKTCAAAGAGSIFGFFSMSCPTCVGWLVALFGSAALLAYFEPVRPILGAISVLVLAVVFLYNLPPCLQKKRRF